MPRYEDDYDHDDFEDIARRSRRDAASMPHSGMGIASLIIAVLAGIGMFLCVVVATAETLKKGGVPNDQDPLMIVTGLAIMGGCALCLLGLVLGVIGSVQSDRKALFGILGAIFNALILIGVTALICVGLTVKK